jgi:hypothetical protein
MPWRAFFDRLQRRRVTAEQIRALDEAITARLAERKADRAAR